jgi:hypothetical protein
MSGESVAAVVVAAVAVAAVAHPLVLSALSSTLHPFTLHDEVRISSQRYTTWYTDSPVPLSPFHS